MIMLAGTTKEAALISRRTKDLADRPCGNADQRAREYARRSVA
jgi:hypothetical protein